MNTGKQINAMVVVLFLTLLALGAYALFDPFRAEQSEDEQLELTVERAAETFALNCRLCHGDRGEGGADGGRLPAAPGLDRPALQGIDQGMFSEAALDEDFAFVSNTIMCGRPGTAMPAWGRDQGGTLSDVQIRQLTVLITRGRWDEAAEHAREIDAEATEHATVRMPDGSLPAQSEELVVSDASPFSRGQYVRLEEERLRVLPDALIVERAVDGTEAAEHETGATIFSVDSAGGTDEVFGEGDTDPETLAEAMDDETTMLAVAELEPFAVGDTLQIDDERMAVVDLVTGLPTTRHVIAEDIGREPDTFLISGSEGVEAGMVIRLGGELMDVREVRPDGETGITLDEDVSASADRIAVSAPVFFAEDYVLRVGDELIEVIGPVDTGQTLGTSIGRAETSFDVSGIAGLSEGMVIRMRSELMRIESIEPARVELERAADDTQGRSHATGTAFFVPPPETEDGEEPAEPAEPETTDQTLVEPLGATDTTAVVSGTTGLTVEETYLLGDERVRIVDSTPARVSVERAVGGTEEAEHGRRLPLFEGNLLEVERGVGGSSAAALAAGDEVFLTELLVDREVEGSELEDHAKGDEIFLGNQLIVERGALNTEPAEHPNGTLVLNFPIAPDSPSVTGTTCGQPAPAVDEGPTGPTPTPLAGAQEVDVSLDEFNVIPAQESIVDGPVQFNVTNDGTVVHNFRVIATDLAPDALPLDGTMVDEGALDVVASSATIGPSASEGVPAQMPPGGYVLICNIPGHYENGMFVGFEVSAP